MMECGKGLVLIALTAVCLSVAPWGFGELPEQELKQIATYEFGESREALTVVTDYVRDSYASKSEREALAQRLAAILEGNATFAGQQFVCRQLALIGTAGQVPVLAKLLNEQTADVARYALERIPAPEAGAALVAALNGASGKTQVGIINSLGKRGEGAAVSVLAPLLGSDDAAVATAAAAALGAIATPEAAQALAGAVRKAGGNVPLALSDAYLLCADELLRNGDEDEAEKIYAKLYQPRAAAPAKVAALKGLILTRGAKAGPLVLEALRSDDPLVRSVAVEAIRGGKGKAETKAFADILPQLSPESQVVLMNALADRGDKAALPAIEAGARNYDEHVRTGAYEALGKIGEPSSVELLVAAAATAPGKEKGVAADSLAVMPGKGINRALLKQLQKADANGKVVAIKALSARRAEEAVDGVMRATGDEKQFVRREAFKALSALASEKELPDLLKLLGDVENDGDRNEAKKTVSAVARRAPKESDATGQLLAACRKAKDAPTKAALLSVLGELGSPRALTLLREEVGSEDEQTRDAAVRALVNWPDAVALSDLYEIAKTSENETHKVLALGGYLRLAGAAKVENDSERVKLYRLALNVATRPDEKRKALGGLGRIHTLESLNAVGPSLKDDDLADEAALAVVSIAPAIASEQRETALAALRSVERTSAWYSTKDKAKSAVDKIVKFEGHVPVWLVAGPYLEDGKNGTEIFDVAFAPEDPKSDAAVEWKEMKAVGSPPWQIDLTQSGFNGGNRCAYLRAKVKSPKAQSARLEAGSDDGVKAWINGQLAIANNRSGGAQPAAEKAEVELREGWNYVMLMINNGGGGWGGGARVVGADGGALEGLEYGVDGLEDTKLFTGAVAPKGVTALQVEDEGAVYELSAAEKAEGYALLFDGASLDQWDAVGRKEGWSFTKDRIRSACPATEEKPWENWLRSKKEYGDFLLRLQWRVAPGGDSGVFLRCAKSGRPWETGLEVQIVNEPTIEGLQTGAIYGLAKAVQAPDQAAGVWHELSIRFVKNELIVVCGDDCTINTIGQEAEAATSRPAKGHVGLQAAQIAGGFIEFRNIRIKEMTGK